MKKCVVCGIEKPLDEFYQRKNKSFRNDCKRCLLDYHVKRWKSRKIKAISLFGSKCCKCNYNKNLAALDFHHLNPKEKEYDWRRLVKKPWNKVVEELKKCVLLCKNCHAETHNPNCNLDCVDSSYGNFSLDEEKHIKSTGKCSICLINVFGTKYCSSECSKKATRKVERPSKEELIELMKTMNWSEIGRKYGVSDNAIRKWARNYKIFDIKKLSY